MDERSRPRRILPVIIVSQFAGTSLWFAGNAILGDLEQHWGAGTGAVGYVTSAVQLGFIAGTLAFAFFAIADRFSPRNVFFVCSLAGAASNLALYFTATQFGAVLALRFATGFFLAGIYPVGMKIAAGWYRSGLGSAIGFLVGALVLGTAFPHLLKGAGYTLPWEAVTVIVSVTAAAGGLLMRVFVPDGPFLTRASRFDPRAFAAIFARPLFRSSAFGYFGHMWELYAFWAFLPYVLSAHATAAGAVLDVAFWSFCVIGVGALGCAGGGLASLRFGSAPVAFAQLSVSGLCCVLSPLFFHAPTPVFLAFLALWGIAVVGDSPQFSALNARNAPPELVGSALTVANCIGFSITIISIQLLDYLAEAVGGAYLYVVLAIGPALGIVALMPLMRRSPASPSPS
jgi:MFS family permease